MAATPSACNSDSIPPLTGAADPLAGRLLSLHQLTVMEVPDTATLASVAARAGYQAVDLFVRFRDGAWQRPPTVETPAAFAAARRAFRDAGVRAHNLESFLLTPRFDWDAYRARLEGGAELGASRVTLFLVDRDRVRGEESLARAAAIAAGYGLQIGLEAAPISLIRPLAELAAYIRRLRLPNVRLVVDLLHTARNGDGLAEIAALAPDLIGSVQLCDAPALLPDGPGNVMARRMHEAMWQRRFPGEGALPIRSVLNILPADVPLSIEIPHWQAQQSGMDALARARHALTALRALR